jgi:hypothetical protein
MPVTESKCVFDINAENRRQISKGGNPKKEK